MKELSKREVPPWMIVAAAALGIVCLIYFGRQAITGREGDPAPPKKVYPGMYDLRAEAAKMRAAKEQGSQQNGP